MRRISVTRRTWTLDSVSGPQMTQSNETRLLLVWPYEEVVRPIPLAYKKDTERFALVPILYTPRKCHRAPMTTWV